MKTLLDANGQEIEKGQKLRCDNPDGKGRLQPGVVYVCSGRRDNRVALKGHPSSYAGWRFRAVP